MQLNQAGIIAMFLTRVLFTFYSVIAFSGVYVRCIGVYSERKAVDERMANCTQLLEKSNKCGRKFTPEKCLRKSKEDMLKRSVDPCTNPYYGVNFHPEAKACQLCNGQKSDFIKSPGWEHWTVGRVLSSK